MRLTLEFEYASSPHRSDDGGVGFFKKTVDRDLARVPSTGEFIRLDALGGPLAKIQTVIREPPAIPSACLAQHAAVPGARPRSSAGEADRAVPAHHEAARGPHDREHHHGDQDETEENGRGEASPQDSPGFRSWRSAAISRAFVAP